MSGPTKERIAEIKAYLAGVTRAYGSGPWPFARDAMTDLLAALDAAEERAEAAEETARIDRAIRAYFGKPSALADQYRARVRAEALREAEAVCEAEETRYSALADHEPSIAMTGASGGAHRCAERIRALAAKEGA